MPSPQDSSPIIALDEVSFSYAAAPDVRVLDGLSLSVDQGEYVCILGANGSGKSTLLSLMGMLERPTAGSLRLLGRTIDGPEQAARVRGRVAMVFQQPDDQMVTSIVADDVAFGPENLGVPQPEMARRVDEALSAVGMSDYAAADPADLSGGQRQRVAIAGALAMHPDILLLDEPAAMLDAGGRRAIQGIIAELHARGTTIVHVTHFMDDALLAQRIVLLERGRVVLDGPPGDVFARTETIRRLGLELPFTMRLAEELAHSDDRFSRLPATADAVELAHAVAACCGDDRSAAVWGVDDDAADGGAPSEPSAASPVLEFDDVSFSYALASRAGRKPRRRWLPWRGDRHRADRGQAALALEHASFAVAQGTICALVGATGAGKSTTVELACALKVPLSGTVKVAGTDTGDLSRRRELRRVVGYVAQLPERQLFAETVFEDVAFGPRNLRLPDAEVRERVSRALEAVGLDPSPDLLSRSPFELSGGQQRSVAIAGVIAMRPRLLVLDEPMAGLDPAGRKRMRDFIRRLRDSGVTILMVTHDMDDAAELADRVIALRDGRVAAQGTPREVFAPARGDRGETPAPGVPSALSFARELGRDGVRLVPEPLTLDDLVREVMRHGAAR